LRKYKYEDKIIAEFTNRKNLRKERMLVNVDRQILNNRIAEVQDVLPLARQILQFRISISELLAFHNVVYTKAEPITLDEAAYKLADEIRDYSQLGGLKKE
jgi:hypothetical protein